MKKYLCLLLLCALTLPATAQRARFNWEYGADFRYLFDNREFAISQDAVIPSGTTHYAVLTPMVGFSLETPRVRHSVMAGVELGHDMGSHTWADFAREPVIYYNAHVRAKKGAFDAYAGIFPRNCMEGDYGEAFISGQVRSNDRYLEGMLLRWHSERFFSELALDWMGQYGPETREQFLITGAGRWQATSWLQLGWTGAFHHYACSEIAQNVVDNHLLEPWVKLDFSSRNRWQELSVQAGLLVGYQYERGYADAPDIPLGGEFKLTARRWNVMLQNTTYVGGNQMPLFFRLDPAGIPYATNLYFGTPCYNEFFDLAEAAWMPRILPNLRLKIAARFYFDKLGLLGWQQICSLQFSL